MKKLFLSVLFASAVLFSLQCITSCTQTDLDDQEEETPVPAPEPEKPKVQHGTFKFVASAIKETWEVGDKIYVHGSYGPKAQVVTVSSISADGKTATAELGEDVTKYLAEPDFLYAVYPASAVEEEDGLMESGVTLKEFLIPVSAAYLEGDTFKFADASAGLGFTVSGDFDKYAIAGKMRPGLNITGYSFDYTSENPKFGKARDNGYPFLYGDLESGKAVTHWFPGGLTLSKGYTIYLGKDGAWPKAYTVTEDLKLDPGTFADLGDIAALATEYDGPEPIMPTMVGTYTKFTVKDVPELSGLCLSQDKDFLWCVGDEGHLGKISFDGKLLSIKSIGGDLEGVSMDPENGDLLVSNEPNGVNRIPAPDFSKRNKIFVISDAKDYGNSGAEGITYYKDNMVYVGTQIGADLFLCDLSSGEVIWKKRLRSMYPAMLEIADLCYDPLTDWLWIIDSEAHKIFALSGDAENLLGAYSLKTKLNEESLCIDHANSCIWVGDDNEPSAVYCYPFEGLDDAIVK